MRVARVCTAWAEDDLGKILPHRQDGGYRTRMTGKERLFSALYSSYFVHSIIYLFNLQTIRTSMTCRRYLSTYG